MNINFTPSKEDSSKLLKCTINLKQKKNHEVVWEPQVIFNSERQINQNRSYGLQNLLKLNNRDVFGHAEQFDINWTLGLESQYGAGIFKINSISNNINLDLILPFLALGRNKFNQKVLIRNKPYLLQGLLKKTTSYSIEPRSLLVLSMKSIKKTGLINSRHCKLVSTTPLLTINKMS